MVIKCGMKMNYIDCELIECDVKWGMIIKCELCMPIWFGWMMMRNCEKCINIKELNKLFDVWNVIYIHRFWYCWIMIKYSMKWNMDTEVWIVYVHEKWLKYELKMCMWLDWWEWELMRNGEENVW